MPFYCCPCRGIKALCCHLQHRSSSVAPDWWSSQSSIRAHTHAHALITIFQIHFTQHPVFIGSYSLFIAYLWVEEHRRRPTRRMNIKLGVQQRGGARAEGSVCVHLCMCHPRFLSALVPTLPECTHNKSQPCGCFFFLSCKSQPFP